MDTIEKCCGEEVNKCKGPVEKRRQNTQFQNEESNWVVCCEACFEKIQALWADKWADYYSGCL